MFAFSRNLRVMLELSCLQRRLLMISPAGEIVAKI
jgi:hypothetical protein